MEVKEGRNNEIVIFEAKHINNAMEEEFEEVNSVVAKFATVQKEGIRKVIRAMK